MRTSLQDAPQSPYSDDEMLQKNRDCILYKNKILIDMNKPDVKQDLIFLGKLQEYNLDSFVAFHHRCRGFGGHLVG